MSFPCQRQRTVSRQKKLLTLQYNTGPFYCLTLQSKRNREKTERTERDEGHIKGDNGGHTGNGGEPCHSVGLNLGAAS